MAKKLNETVVNLYSIYDKSSEEYAPLFEAVNNKVALRSFKLSFLTQVPEIIHNDYLLFKVGSRDIKTNKIDISRMEEVTEEKEFNKD